MSLIQLFSNEIEDEREWSDINTGLCFYTDYDSSNVVMVMISKWELPAHKEKWITPNICV